MGKVKGYADAAQLAEALKYLVNRPVFTNYTKDRNCSAMDKATLATAVWIATVRRCMKLSPTLNFKPTCITEALQKIAQDQPIFLFELVWG